MSHYCKICGCYKSNESFSGGGHAQHICKKCRKLPVEVREERITLNRIFDLPFRLSKGNRQWLEKMKDDPREAVQEAASHEWNLRFAPWIRASQSSDNEKEEEYEDEPFESSWDDNTEYSWLLDEGISPDPDWVPPEDYDLELPF